MEVFNNVSGCIKSAFSGYNGTIIAYGQTGSGKDVYIFEVKHTLCLGAIGRPSST